MVEMGQVAIIRHLVNSEKQSIRQVSRSLGLSRNTVRKYVRGGVPAAVGSMPRRRPKMEEVGPRIEKIIEEWSTRTTPKQRITGSRIHAQLVSEGYKVGTTTVRTYLREKRRREAEIYIPLTHWAGEEAQVDFFAVSVDVDGERRQAHLLQFSLPYSDHDFARVYEREDLPSFLDGHVRAFHHFGGVPKRLVYDNAKVAVTRITAGARQLNGHFQRLIAHFAFEADFARPREGHDKGAIEVRGKRTRLTQLVPIPAGPTLAAINEALEAQLAERAARTRNAQGRGIAERLEEERTRFMPLPDADFEARVPAAVSMTRQSTIRLGGGTYSVPTHWKGLPLLAWVGATDVRFECQGDTLLTSRLNQGGKDIRYLHYLPELAQRPHAVRQVAAGLIPELGEPWVGLGKLLLEVHPVDRAARVVSNLLAVRLLYEQELEAALAAVVALPEMPDQDHEPEPPTVVSVPTALAIHEVEAADAARYDALLVGGRP